MAEGAAKDSGGRVKINLQSRPQMNVSGPDVIRLVRSGQVEIGAAALGAFVLMCCLRLLQTILLLPSRNVAAIEALTGPRSYVEEAQEALDALPEGDGTGKE